jgi:hypothetical protein
MKLYEQDIPMETLPRTFQDAVIVAQKLQINYLWIDALCIVQDDAEDWEVECLRMGDYYKNAYVTLSVLNASGSSEGFLSLRPEIPTVKLAEDSPFYIRRETVQRKVFEEAALSKRGWTLQERLLSTRILHYSTSEMFWECNTCSTREGSAAEHEEQLKERLLGDMEGADFKRILQQITINPKLPEKDIFAVWYRLVKQYTRRSLSWPSDKFPAISALATSFGDASGFNYIAGIWAEDAQGLLWLRSVKGQATDAVYHSYTWEPEHYRAPSWSWASIDDPVLFAFSEEDRTYSSNDATIVQGSVENVESSKSGTVLSGSLTLRAFSKKVQCLPAWGNCEVYIGGFSKESQAVERHRKYYEVGIPEYRYSINIFDEVGEWFGLGICDDPVLEDMLGDCTAVWIGEYIYDGRTPTTAIYYLLIVPDEAEPTKWRRVGLGVTREDPSLQGFFTTVYDNYDWEDFELV